ncbi:MAG: LysO family transporter [Candidatus Egerieousia sp.]
MLIALGIMILGVIIGRLFRKKIKFSVSLVILISCCALLFAMGLKVGLDDHIMGNLSSLGVVSLLLALAAMAGSIILAVVFSKWMSKGK